MERTLTCIICPRGCSLKATMEGERKVLKVEGNHCRRGEEYARSECTDPRRTLTTTLRCEDGTMVPVKTEKEIPKDRMAEAMKQINGVRVKLPVKIGDVIVDDVFGSPLVATGNRS